MSRWSSNAMTDQCRLGELLVRQGIITRGLAVHLGPQDGLPGGGRRNFAVVSPM